MSTLSTVVIGKFRMPRTVTVPIRFGEAERDALERAAKEDVRSLSAMARKIVLEWLRENGYLAPEN